MALVQDRFLHPSDKRAVYSKVVTVDASSRVTVREFYSDFDGTIPLYKWVLSYDNGATDDEPNIKVYKKGEDY